MGCSVTLRLLLHWARLPSRAMQRVSNSPPLLPLPASKAVPRRCSAVTCKALRWPTANSAKWWPIWHKLPANWISWPKSCVRRSDASSNASGIRLRHFYLWRAARRSAVLIWLLTCSLLRGVGLALRQVLLAVADGRWRHGGDLARFQPALEAVGVGHVGVFAKGIQPHERHRTVIHHGIHHQTAAGFAGVAGFAQLHAPARFAHQVVGVAKTQGVVGFAERLGLFRGGAELADQRVLAC